MSTPFLLVPLKVEGLFVERGREAVEAMADFSRLPYLQRHTDGGFFEQNTEQPFLSETVANAPLSDTASAWLKPGVHLHWKLPTALTTAYHPISEGGEQNRAEVEFPVAPNRWLVCRWLGSILQKSWLVESDYLWPPEFDLNKLPEEEREGLVTYPYHIERDADGVRMLAEHPGEPPFRYLGRRRELGAAWPQADPPTYLKDVGHRLTAIGYGEPTFAAFYPNCRSVFGLYDHNGMDAKSLWYEVFGWYDSADDDPLQQYTRWLDPATLDARTFIGRYQAWFGRGLSFKLGDEAMAVLEQNKVAPDLLKKLRSAAAGQSFADDKSFLQTITTVIGRDTTAQYTDALLAAGVDIAHHYRLDQAALAELAATGLPQELLDALGGLKDKLFVSEQSFLNAIGADGAPYRTQLLASGRMHEHVWQQLYVEWARAALWLELGGRGQTRADHVLWARGAAWLRLNSGSRDRPERGRG